MRKILSLLAMILALTAQGQMMDPVHFTSELKMLNGKEAEIVFSGTIDDGWHVYAPNQAADGPTAASFNAVTMDGVETVGPLKGQSSLISQYDKLFETQVSYYAKKVTFVQKVRFTKPQYNIDCYLEYGACNDEMCMPPTEVALKKSGEAPKAPPSSPEGDTAVPSPDNTTTPQAPLSSPEGDTIVASPDSTTIEAPSGAVGGALGAVGGTDASALWSPVIDELRSEGGIGELSQRSLLYILLMGFIGGLLAVLMPCIWPIIPMTVSFFLKRDKTDKKKGIRDAITYGLSIIVIYLVLGLLVTALFGSDALNAMSTNAVFNVFLFLLLVVFALSFFGWFEIRLPESWATKVDAKADELQSANLKSKSSNIKSLLSIFLMAFTLVLVSFSCTAPIIGLLLVETTTSGNWLSPTVGMFGFAVALALPFTLFALFPSWLKQAPKSGSWMNTLKVVLGFIELAFALKFLSVADLAYHWHILDREVFLSLWIVISALLGAYLCGWLRFQSDDAGGERKAMPVVCIMGGMVSLAFAVYMVPGLWGAPCKAVSAFAPPMNTQDFNLNTHVVEARFTDYDLGMAAARAEGKPVMVDFTGFGCVNCRKMEAAVWSDPAVADKLTNDYVLISLYVDDKTPLPEPFVVTDNNGNEKTLRTVGAKWSYLQSYKFGSNAQPFYVLLDNDGKPLNGSRAYDEDVDAYLQFLNSGLQRYADRKQ